MTEEAKVERRGRKTKEQEARDYIEAQGLDPDVVLAGAADDAFPETPAEMRAAFMRILWSKRNTLSDTAFTQALNAMVKWSTDASQDEAGAPAEPLIADVLAGIAALSDGRRREILEGALVRLDEERTRIVEMLDV